MQVYAIKIQYFFRYGEKDNTLVFDLTEDEKLQMLHNKLTMDEVYARVISDPVAHVKAVKQRGLEKMIGVAGFTDGNLDYSNGVGKSTIFESICYAHYEKIVRKLANTDKTGKAGVSVVTKIDGKYPENMRQSFVEEIFEENGFIYRIKRGSNFTKTGKKDSPILEFECYTDGGIETANSHRKPDTNKTIDDVNANDYDIFVNTQMFAQNDAGKFLVGADKTKKEMIIALLKIENIINGCLSEIRIRKNSQDKKVNTLRTAIGVMEENLLSTCKTGVLSKAISSDYLDKITGELTQEHIDYIIKSVEDKADNLSRSVEKTVALICEKDKEISELTHSSAVTLAKTLKEEGKRIVEGIADKQKKLEEQTKEWDGLIKDANAIIVKCGEGITASNKKSSTLNEELNLLENSNKSFNIEEIKANIELAKKARNAKPKYEENEKKETEEKLNCYKKVASLQSNKEHFTEELNGYKKQLSSVSGDSFVCKHCRSVVTKEHIEKQIESVISKITEINKLLEQAELNVKTISAKLVITENKLSKINDIILQESKSLSKSKEFELNKKRIDEIKNLILEYENSVKIFKQDMQNAENKKIEYNKKKNDASESTQVEIDRLQKQLNDLRVKYNEIKKTADEIVEKIKTLTAERDKLKEVQESTNKEIAVLNTHCEMMLKNWEKMLGNKEELGIEKKLLNRYLVLEDVFGLDGIQTRVVQRVLTPLNRYIKEYLDILTDGVTQAKLIINDKSEVAMVISGASADTYEMLSGGEKMVVRLAVDIGLALLAFSKLSRDPELICLDEIFGPLDNFHKEAVFRVLEKLNEKFNRVVIITHHQDIQKLIKNNIIIERNSGLGGMSSIKRIGEIPNYNFEQQLENLEVTK